MPSRPPSFCAQPGCPNPGNPRCPDHAVTRQHQTQAHIYKTKRWQLTRRRILRDHPVCTHPGCTTLATPVDHVTPLSEGGDPWDEANLQALCTSHHNAKTRRENATI